MPGKERRRSTSLHAMCNKALGLRNKIRDLAQAGEPIPITSGAVVKIMENAADLLAVIGVQEGGPVVTVGWHGSPPHVDSIALPNDYVMRLEALALSEPNPTTRRTLKSKISYAKWNLSFAALVVGLGYALGPLVLPAAEDSGRGSASRPRRDRLPSLAEPMAGPGILLTGPTGGNADVTARRPQGAEDDVRDGGPAPAERPPAETDFPLKPLPTDRAAPTVSGIEAGQPPTSPREAPHRVPTDTDPAFRAQVEPAPGDAPHTVASGHGARERGDRGPRVTIVDPIGVASGTGGLAQPEETGRTPPVALRIDAAPPAGRETIRPEAPVAEAAGRVLFNPPAGEGLARTVDGVEFHYDACLDVWLNETEAQHRARVDSTIERLLGAAPPVESEPWHAYLPVSASLEISRLLATAILGGYGEVIGREFDRMRFEVNAAAPLEKLDLRRMLGKAMLVLWENTPWYDKVMAETPSGAMEPDLWETIGSNHRNFDEDRASWIEVGTEESQTTGTGNDGDEPECVIEPESGNPRSRFADAGAAIRSKSLPNEREERNHWTVRSQTPLPERASILLLGIGGSGKSHAIQTHLKWLANRYPNTVVFSLDASRVGVGKKEFRKIVRAMTIAEAEGKFCVVVCDEVQHLSAMDLEELGICSAVVLAGDVRQSGHVGRVHPVIAFARQIGAEVIDMKQVWRAANTSLLNQISFVFYDSAFSALGNWGGVREPPIFRYDLCSDDGEVIAARCWAVARTVKATARSLMLVLERDDVRDAMLRMAGCDRRQWTKGRGSVRVLKPSQIQGQEADVVMFLPDDFVGSEEDPERTARSFLTLVGRARQEIWVLFTRPANLGTPSQRLFASLLRSCLETSVTVAALPSEVELRPSHKDFLDGLELTVHPIGAWQLLAYRGRAVALYEPDIWKSTANLRSFGELRGWPVWALMHTSRSLELRSLTGSGNAVDDELRKRKEEINRQLASDRE